MNLRNRISGAHIPALDGIRGISALLVVCAHTGVLPRQFGALGVAIFFVLSGFLITWLLLKEHERTGGISLKAFYIRRTLRIFPAFYVFWILCVGAAIVNRTTIHAAEIWSSFWYVGDYYNGLKQALWPHARGIMGITWSLAVEEKFYLIWPWIFARYRQDTSKLLKVGIGVMAAIGIYRVVLWTFGHPPTDYLRYAFEARLDNILWGAMLAVLVKSGRLKGFCTRVASHALLPIPVAAALVASVMLEQRLGPTYHYLYGMPLDAFLIVILLVQFMTMSGSFLWRWLDSPPLRFSGKISYSIYLYHWTVITLVEEHLSGSRWSVQLLVSFLAVIALAALSYKFVEAPFLRLKDRLIPQEKRPAQQMAISVS